MNNKGKVNINPRIGHDGLQVEMRYSSSDSLTSEVDVVGSQINAPAALPPGKRHGTHCTKGWMGPRAGRDGRRKSHCNRYSICEPSRP